MGNLEMVYEGIGGLVEGPSYLCPQNEHNGKCDISKALRVVARNSGVAKPLAPLEDVASVMIRYGEDVSKLINLSFMKLRALCVLKYQIVLIDYEI